MLQNQQNQIAILRRKKTPKNRAKQDASSFCVKRDFSSCRNKGERRERERGEFFLAMEQRREEVIFKIRCFCEKRAKKKQQKS